MKDFSIKSKVRFSFGLLTAFVIINAVLSILFITSISGRVDDLYNHPFTVTSAIRSVETESYHHYSTTHYLSLSNATTVQEFTEARNQIASQHQNIISEFITLDDFYLGDMLDVDEVKGSYATLYAHVLDAIEHLENNEDVEARELMTLINGEDIPNLLEELSDMKEFADNKAIEFREQANNIKSGYILTITISSSVMVIAAFVLFTLMLKDIFPAIEKIVDTIESYKSGKNINTLDLERKDEIGYVGRTFTQMLDSIKTQTEIEALSLKLSTLRAKEHLSITLMSIGDGVISTDLKGNVTNVNQVALDMLGLSSNEVMDQYILDVMEIINKDNRKKVINPIQEALKSNQTASSEEDVILVSRNGNEYEISDSASPIQDKDGTIYGAVLVFRDATEENQSKREIEYLSYHDSLTGLYNRNFLEKVIFDLENKTQSNVAVLMGDVNGLKITNDAFGHTLGDLLLKDISTILVQSTPEERTTIVRWGGDEFVIIIENTNQKEIESIIRTINHNSDNWNSQSPVSPSISFGYAIKKHSNENLYRTLIKAEDMMYENKLLRKDSLRSAIVQSLQTSLYEKSYETEEHANRVAEFGELIARKLGLPDHEVNAVILLSRLHDVGKIAISDKLLLKPGKLSQDEWREVRKHPETGYRIASSLNELTHIADGILCHHEHYDGNGYPRGLKGDQIPLHARIVSIADAYDVMRSDRSYKKAVSKEKAIELLRRNKGTQFDPELVELFIDIIKK